MKTFFRLLPALFFCLVGTAELAAQIDTNDIDTIPYHEDRPDLYKTLQDGSHFYLVPDGGGPPRDPNMVSAAYIYEMLYDSICNITYLFTECKRNETLLRLPTWENWRTVNADAALLSFQSTSDSFTCRTGDTLSFYRELMWRDPRTQWQDTNSYYALDDLDFSVELVRTSDFKRVALLDSIGMLSSPIMGRPQLHGFRPIFAQIKYTVPSELNNVQAFMRVLLYHRGSGAYWFTRSDQITVGVSGRLLDSDWIAYLDYFGYGQSSNRISLDELDRSLRTTSAGRALSIEQSNASPRDIAITLESAAHGNTAVGIYDLLGNAVFFPYMTPRSTGTVRLHHRFDRSGTFFVVLIHDGHVVETKQVHILP